MAGASHDKNQAGPPPQEPDAVGYGSPPAHARFKPGQSGNPRGRPKKPSSTGEAFDQIARKKVATADGRRVPVTEAIVLGQTAKAIKGDSKAAQFVFGGIAEREAKSIDAAPALSPEDRAIYGRAIRRLNQVGQFE